MMKKALTTETNMKQSVKKLNLVCIYFDSRGLCTANPHTAEEYYRPDEETKKLYCKNIDHMKECPRVLMYENYLKALGQKKKKKG